MTNCIEPVYLIVLSKSVFIHHQNIKKLGIEMF